MCDPYGGLPRLEDEDVDDLASPALAAARSSSASYDLQPTYMSFRDIVLSMQSLNAKLPPASETSVKRWARRVLTRVAGSDEEDGTPLPSPKGRQEKTASAEGLPKKEAKRKPSSEAAEGPERSSSTQDGTRSSPSIDSPVVAVASSPPQEAVPIIPARSLLHSGRHHSPQQQPQGIPSSSSPSIVPSPVVAVGASTAVGSSPLYRKHAPTLISLPPVSSLQHQHHPRQQLPTSGLGGTSPIYGPAHGEPVRSSFECMSSSISNSFPNQSTSFTDLNACFAAGNSGKANGSATVGCPTQYAQLQHQRQQQRYLAHSAGSSCDEGSGNGSPSPVAAGMAKPSSHAIAAARQQPFLYVEGSVPPPFTVPTLDMSPSASPHLTAATRPHNGYGSFGAPRE